MPVIRVRVSESVIESVRPYARSQKIPYLSTALKKLVDISLEAEATRQDIDTVIRRQQALAYLISEILVTNRLILEGRTREGHQRVKELTGEVYQQLLQQT